jgi:hypothetical protein
LETSATIGAELSSDEPVAGGDTTPAGGRSAFRSTFPLLVRGHSSSPGHGARVV